MSMMSELIIEVQDLVLEGVPVLAIATALNVPVDLVNEIKEVMESAEEECENNC
jgi:hypothetical protein